MKSNPVLILLGMLGHASALMAQSPGMFTTTGSMSAPRAGHTATLLNNGKVLVAAGDHTILTPSASMVPITSAELYDPTTGTFSASGDLIIPRSGHTATLLPDGRVLIAGGGGYPYDYSSLSDAELYDPSTETFTATGMMITARRLHTATLLNTGKVLVAGGVDGDFPSKGLTSAELYDPLTGTFTPTGSLNSARWISTATLLNDGRVLIDGEDATGGCHCGVSAAEIYDPATGTFSPAGKGADPSQFPVTATALTNGKILDTLEYSCDPSDSAELYDPLAGTFTLTAKMTAIRYGGSATLIPDGTVLITGDALNLNPQNVAELYDPVAGQFSLVGHTTTERSGHSATLLPDGTVLIAGGTLCCGNSSAELYHPSVLVSSPVLLSLSGDGRGQGAILHASTQQIVSPDNPGVAGEALEIFGTGLVDGSVIPPQVSIGGQLAEVLYFGKAPGNPSLNQINIRVPNGTVPGSAVPVRMNYLSRPSNEVTLAVQ